jgi:quercetin dioxygenase-like cupin family protein
LGALFPPPILGLPQADIPLAGVEAYLSQGDDHQILFMTFNQDVDLPEHAHASQWGIVLEGRIDLTIDGETRSYLKGERYFIPADTLHSGRIHAGYADITYFDQVDRYPVKSNSAHLE